MVDDLAPQPSTSDRPNRRRPTPEWLSITQYAKAYGVHRDTVRKWLDLDASKEPGAKRILVTFKIGKVVRINDLPPSS